MGEKTITGQIGGGPLTVVATQQPYDCRRLFAFTQMPTVLNMNEDASNTGEAPFTRGQVLLTAQVVDDPTSGPAHTSLELEVNLIGAVGSARTVIARVAFTQFYTVAQVPVDDPYDWIGFEARQNVDGLPDSGVTPINLSFQALGRFFR